MNYSLSDFIIDNSVLQQYWDIVNLIIASETISDKEQKQYWISSLADMDDDQMGSLKSILWEEQEWLKKISEEFNEWVSKEEAEKAEKAEVERLRRKKEREEREREFKERDAEVEEGLLAELERL